MTVVPDLPPALAALVDEEWPRFSAAEMSWRRDAVETLLDSVDARHALVYGNNRNGTGVPWLTHWPTTSEAALVVTRGERSALFVQYHNHVPQAQQAATDCDVAWGGADTIATVIETLNARGATPADRIGVIGPLGMGAQAKLAAAFPMLVDLNGVYTRLRMTKSPEEIEWMRIGAWFCDRAMAAVEGRLAPGVTERDLGDACERAWVPLGGTTGIHFFGSTAMDAPDCMVPRQFPSTRQIVAGDVMFCEITGMFQGYGGQVLRSFTVAADPTPLYRDLHAAADGAFDAIRKVLRAGAHPQDVIDASGVIEEAGFTTCDDLMHGFGAGYLPPIVGSASRPAGPVPSFPFEAGMLVVIQPNVVTRDGKAGIQTGECLQITEDGCESIHSFPRGFRRVG